ncbi:MAG: type II toxin-antitoxin system RelB/DinJ family antitoxin [Proteobacteria bacterium]|nr:type II toxin-antitoxin system RelB/DinJ family antitoxin [Pseudomonadota bacterium]
MFKTAIVSIQIKPRLKTKAETILYKIGLSSAEAIRLFYKKICLHHGLPFEVKIPNKTTINAMRETDSGKTHKAKNVDALFDELE